MRVPLTRLTLFVLLALFARGEQANVPSSVERGETYLHTIIESGDLARAAAIACRRAGLSRQAADDIGAEVLLTFAEKPELLNLPTYEDLVRLAGTMAANAAVDVKRGLATVKRGGEAETKGGLTADTSPKSQEPPPDEIAAQTELLKQVERMIQEQPKNARDFLRLVVLEDMPRIEAAEQAGIATRTADRVLADFRRLAHSQLVDCHDLSVMRRFDQR